MNIKEAFLTNSSRLRIQLEQEIGLSEFEQTKSSPDK